MGDDGNPHAESRAVCRLWLDRTLRLLLVPFLPGAIFSLLLVQAAFGQTELPDPATPLPSAPLPVIKHQHSKSGACRVVPKGESVGKTLTAVGSSYLATVAGFPPIDQTEQQTAQQTAEQAATEKPLDPSDLPPCTPPPLIDWYMRFLNGPEVKPLTPREKGRLAIKNLMDPFNAITILGTAAVSIGADPHSAYGPGMPGFGRYVGVAYTQDMTAEFLGTFLIPSIFHQDPHYHRMPHATIPRRVWHGIVQIVWTQGDNGKGMLNYSNIIGFPIGAEISNFYVPGVQTDVHATVTRVVTGAALAPTDNFITEFLPDVARHIHFRVVFMQQIINQVARTEGGGESQ